MTDHHTNTDIIVAGHICLDVIPTFEQTGGDWRQVIAPGKLVNVGQAVTATGGAVANTGLALHRLGLPTRLMGKLGDDLFGQAILDLLNHNNPALAKGMIVEPGEVTSYTVVLSPPGVDRIFFHNPGANDTFSDADVSTAALAGAGLFHFGYPPLMRHMFADGGKALARLLQKAKAAGLTTSLDMAYPDRNSAAGQADWRTLLAHVLPHVDIFLPSIEETLFMLERPLFTQLSAQGDILDQLDGKLLSRVGNLLLEMGAAVAVLKLGHRGLAVQTSADVTRLEETGACRPADVQAWRNRQLLTSCFKTNVAGTTGAGDCTIAGFLAGLCRGLSLEETLTTAVAVGACSVESASATDAIPPWESVRERVAAGWEKLPQTIPLPGWQEDSAAGLWRGPSDGN
ncbi:MAG: carbohydrate kinase family protein [Chloroflexi bacterium]|nr:MAG: carbohydrate kinase family protein [Chloroflexota bacterium]